MFGRPRDFSHSGAAMNHAPRVLLLRVHFLREVRSRSAAAVVLVEVEDFGVLLEAEKVFRSVPLCPASGITSSIWRDPAADWSGSKPIRTVNGFLLTID